MAASSVTTNLKEKVDAERAVQIALLDHSHVESMRGIYDTILEEFPPDFGKALSKREREDKKMYVSTLIYGEIDFDSFGLIIQKIRQIYGRPNTGASGPAGFLQTRGGIFYDLGSGIGRALVAAATLYPFDACIGIELLEGLYNGSLLVVDAYNSKGRSALNRPIDTLLEVKHGDILNLECKDWRDGDLVFINSTCFDEPLMNKIANIAVGMKKGSFIVTLTKRLNSSDFQLLEYELHEMSWGGATVYIHQKTTDSREIEVDSDDDA